LAIESSVQLEIPPSIASKSGSRHIAVDQLPALKSNSTKLGIFATTSGRSCHVGIHPDGVGWPDPPLLMISNHYPLLFATGYNQLIVAIVTGEERAQIAAWLAAQDQ
jgi:hypothetical protein